MELEKINDRIKQSRAEHRREMSFVTKLLVDPKSGQHLKNELGDPLIFLGYTPYSSKYRQAVYALQMTALKRKPWVSYKDKMKATSDEASKLLATLSVCIENLTYNGNKVNNYETFLQIYSDTEYEWLKNQIDECIGGAKSYENIN